MILLFVFYKLQAKESSRNDESYNTSHKLH